MFRCCRGVLYKNEFYDEKSEITYKLSKYSHHRSTIKRSMYGYALIKTYKDGSINVLRFVKCTECYPSLFATIQYDKWSSQYYR